LLYAQAPLPPLSDRSARVRFSARIHAGVIERLLWGEADGTGPL
jgi:hypothetical protein